MHRGVREFIRWVRDHAKDGGTVSMEPPATAQGLSSLEHQLGSPLPADHRLVLGVFNGATLPSGRLLSAIPGPGHTIDAALRQIAQFFEQDFLDVELPLPFHRTSAGSFLCFDRSAAPVQDTWPIVDFDPESGLLRLTHRTFDGWCRLCVAEWTSDDFEDEFSVEKYLAQGTRHADIEPDVSIAHVTVAHAHRRAGEPEESLERYLKAARCVPPISWADWEALKLAALLRNAGDAFEAGSRLAKRAPPEMWEERGGTPSQAAFAIAKVAPAGQGQWLRLIDLLCDQALDEDDKHAAEGIRAALNAQAPLPAPHPPAEAEVTPDEDLDVWWAQLCEAYREGSVREDTLLFDVKLGPLAARFDLADVLRIRRDF
jgi:hypothetical protein